MFALRNSLVFGLLMTALLAASPEPQGNEATFENELHSLRQSLQADPANMQVQRKLVELNKRRQDQTRWAYGALAMGLELYIEVGPDAAQAWLKKAQTSPEAVRFMDQFSSVSLADMISQGDDHPQEHYCPACAGTGWQDCLVCNGSGTRTCYLCSGAGKQPAGPGQQGPTLCSRCRGLGLTDCSSCRGYGIVKCRKCAGKCFLPRQAKAELDPGTIKAMKKLIARAQYLYQGGIDYFTLDAMRTTMEQNPALRQDRLMNAPEPSEVDIQEGGR